MLVLGTTNPNKVNEFSRLLNGVPLCGLDDVDCSVDVRETGSTYRENAALKARAYAQATGHWVLSDDTGLEVPALGGAPGIYSARFAGEDATGAENVSKLLGALEGVEQRQASFHCALALSDPAGRIVLESTGRLDGRILTEQKGIGGFTYDYVFFEEKSGCTLAEMPLFAVDKLSHRAKAVIAIKEDLLEQFSD